MEPRDYYGWSRSFAVYRQLEQDSLIRAFYRLCAEETPENFGAFVSELYNTGTDSWTDALTQRVLALETPVTQLAGKGEPIPESMRVAAKTELKVLEEMGQASPDHFSVFGYKPGWTVHDCVLYEPFLERLRRIGKWGYGQYARHVMFRVEGMEIVPVRHPDPICLDDLVCCERQKALVYKNTLALAKGLPAADTLLYGDAGTGKSATVKAVVNALASEGVRLIELTKKDLHKLPAIQDALADNPLKFVLFVDDLGFQENDDEYTALKAVLEGSASYRSPNSVIYATSNRRHIVRESFAQREGDEVHRNDAMQETISLSERFGLRVLYEKPNRQQYQEIVETIAQREGVKKENLVLLAEQFALRKAGRSGRAARQLVDQLKGETEPC